MHLVRPWFPLAAAWLVACAGAVSEPGGPAGDDPTARPPSIDSFSASPASGVAPLTTQLSWAISSAAGASLTCEIDVGSDGVPEQVLSPCNPIDQKAVVIDAAGIIEVALNVSDSQGHKAGKSLTVSVLQPVGDLRLAKAEWGQSVISQDPRLVAGKAALLRLHVLADREGIEGATLRARVLTNGTLRGEVTLTGPATAPTAEVPGDLSQQWVGTVPASWVQPGLEVEAVVDPSDLLLETDETNNSMVLAPQVGASTVIPLTVVPVTQMGLPARLNIDIDLGLQRVWPIQSAAAQLRASYTFTSGLGATSTSSWAQLLSELAAVREADGSSRYYFGLVQVAYASGISGLGYTSIPVAVGRDDSVETAMHEIGHNFGRSHAPCGPAGSVDPSFPYAGGTLGSYGYDFHTRTLIAPDEAFDVMGYCRPEWISDYNYRAVQTALETNPPASGDAAPQANVLLFSGRIDGSGLHLAPVHRMKSRPSLAVEGTHALHLHFADGQRFVVPFEPVRVEDLGADERQFTVLAEDRGPLAAVEVFRGAQLLTRLDSTRTPRAAAPRLVEAEGSLFLEWDSSMHATALLAHLGEADRTTLAISLNGGRAVIDTQRLPPGGSFEVSLSDGLNASRFVFPR